MTPAERELQLDVSAEDARALHRIVRAMHDGHCPNCGCLESSESFVWFEPPCDGPHQRMVGHRCPSCCFTVTEVEARAALLAFQPHLKKLLEVFENWRSERK